MTQRSNVFGHSAPISTKDYRAAVARIVRDLQSGHRLTDQDFAEAIGCSVGTVRNARNEETDLSAMFLARIEAKFGHGSINPYLRLANSRSVPIDGGGENDPLPSIIRASLVISEARDPRSPGGVQEIRPELIGQLADLKRAQADISARIVMIEGLIA